MWSSYGVLFIQYRHLKLVLKLLMIISNSSINFNLYFHFNYPKKHGMRKFLNDQQKQQFTLLNKCNYLINNFCILMYLQRTI